MGTIRTAIQINDGMTPAFRSMNNAMNVVLNSFEAIQSASHNAIDTNSIASARAELAKAAVSFSQIDDEAEKARKKQEELNEKIRQGSSASDGLLSKIKNIAMAAGAAFGAKAIINLADGMTSTTARLNLMNDGLQTTDELQKMIMKSANASRGAYMDTAAAVAKLGITAKGAFDSSAEIVQFAEQMNKQFVIGGASVQETTAGMYQLTQAMAAGKLQGDEFRSILENAPLLAQSIATYMGKTTGELKEMSSQGLITADVIKGAMFAAAEETNAQFAKIPMTFSQVGTLMANTLLQTFDPIIQAIGSAAQFIYDNWAVIEPIFWGLAAAVGVYTLATGISTAVTWLQVAANRALMVSMLSNPIMWIALAIGVLIGIIYKWVQSVGGIRIAWLIVCNALLIAWDWVRVAFQTGINFVVGLWDKLVFALMTAGFAISSFMGDLKVGVLTILQNMINGAIGIINDFIGLLNKIPGVNIGLIGEVTFATTAAAENEAVKQAGQAALDQKSADMAAAAADRDAKIAAMQSKATSDAEARQVEIDAAQSDAAAAAAESDTAKETAAYSGETAGNTESLDSMDDNLEYMRDIAEREAINRFTTAEISIAQTNNNTIGSDMDIDGVMGKWTKDFTEVLETAAEGVYD